MSLVENKVNHARRRLLANILLDRLCIGLLLAAGAWGLLVLVVRAFALGVPVWHVGWIVALLAGAVGLVVAFRARPNALHAAVALDQAAGLKERLSTAIAVGRIGDPFARAAVQDAEGHAGRIHVPAHIRYRSPTLLPWSAATITTALLLAWLMPTLHLFAAEPENTQLVPRDQVRAERDAIQVALDKQLKTIKEFSESKSDLKDLGKDIQPLEMPQSPTATPEDIRREAVKRIDDVQSRLKHELEATDTSSLTELKRMLGRLNSQEGGAQQSDELSRALAEGDFTAAKQALEETLKDLQEAVKNADDPESKQKLQEMQQKLGQLSDQLAKISDSVQLQKELENKAGMSAEDAQKLLDKLSQMDPKQLEKELQRQLGEKGMSKEQVKQLAQKISQSQQAQKACKQLAKSLSKASQACKQACNSGAGSQSGSGSQAQGAVADALGQLSEMEMSEQLMNELEAQLSDLSQLRDNVCQGNMCPPGDGPGQGGGKIGAQGPNYGRGLGSRIGKQATPYKSDPTKAKTRFNSGTVIGQLLVDGPQVRGKASAEVLDAAEAEVRDALDAVDRDELPRQYDKVLREYFERLAGLVQQQQGKPTPAKDAPKP